MMVFLSGNGHRFFGGFASGSLCGVSAAGSRVGACGRGVFLASVAASSLLFSQGSAMGSQVPVVYTASEVIREVQKVEEELQKTRTDLETKHANLDSAIDLFENRVDAPNTGLVAVSAKVTDLETELGALKTRVDAPDTGLSDQFKDLDKLEKDFAVLKAAVDHPVSGLKPVSEAMVSQREEIDDLDQDVSDLEETVDNPDSGLASVNGNVDSLRIRLTNLEANVNDEDEGLEAAHTKLDSHAERLGTLEGTVNDDQSGLVATRRDLQTEKDRLTSLKDMVEDPDTGLAITRETALENAGNILQNTEDIASNRNSITVIQGRFGTMNGADSLALGGRSTSSGSKSVAVGYDATAEGEDSFSAGSGASATAEAAVALGKSSSATGVKSMAFGHGAAASGADSSAMGSASSATGDGSVAFGNAASARGQNSVALGSNSVAEEDNVISVGSGPGGEAESVYRKIVNLADGVSDHDASTYGQLDSRVALEDRAYGAGGSVPTVVLRARQSGQGPSTSFSANAVEASVQRGDGKTVFLSENTHRKRTILSGGTATTTMVLADQDSVAGASSPGVMFSTTMYEGDGYGGLVERRATEPAYRAYRASGKLPRDQENVPAGATGISKSTDANGRAVYTYTTGARIGGVGYGKAPDEAINRAQLDTEIVARMRDSDLVYSGIASLAAVSNIPGLNPGQTKSIGVGAGAFNGSVAFAAGANFRFSDAFSMKASLGYSFDTKEASISGGLSYWW